MRVPYFESKLYARIMTMMPILVLPANCPEPCFRTIRAFHILVIGLLFPVWTYDCVFLYLFDNDGTTQHITMQGFTNLGYTHVAVYTSVSFVLSSHLLASS